MKKIRITFPSQFVPVCNKILPTEQVLKEFSTKLIHSSQQYNNDYILRVTLQEATVVSTLITKILELNKEGKVGLK